MLFKVPDPLSFVPLVDHEVIVVAFCSSVNLEFSHRLITNGGIAGLYTVFAKVDREDFTAFLVERSFPGVTAGPEEKKLGARGSSTTAVILENARVPVENVLGEVGKGHKIAFNVLNLGRFKLGALCMGVAKVAFAEGAKYANARRQFGVPIATFGAIKEKIADSVADIFRAESIVYRVAGLLDRRLGSMGLLAAKRILAATALESEKYIF